MNIFMNIVDEVYLQIASFLLQEIKEEKFTLVFYASSSAEQEERENVRDWSTGKSLQINLEPSKQLFNTWWPTTKKRFGLSPSSASF